MVLLEHNNTIYMGYDMIDSLANPVQCEYNDVIIDLRPKLYYQKKITHSRSLSQMELQSRLSTM